MRGYFTARQDGKFVHVQEIANYKDCVSASVLIDDTLNMCGGNTISEVFH